MLTEVELGASGWLRLGKFRWVRAMVWLCALSAICVLAFNIVADDSLHLSALVAGEAFISRAAAPAGARLLAIIVGAAAMLSVYALSVRLAERRTAAELSLRHLVPDLAIGIMLGGALIAAIIAPMWGAGWVTITAQPVSQIAEALKQSIQSAVIEEVLMRIIIFRLLWRAAGVFPALILTALLFGGLHLSNPEATASQHSAWSPGKGSRLACTC